METGSKSGSDTTAASRPGSESDDSGLTFDFRARVQKIIAMWVVGGIFGVVGAVVRYQLLVWEQIETAFSDAWEPVDGAVSAASASGVGLLELPFDIARELVLSVGPFAVFAGPLAFALVAAVVALLLTGAWYLWQVIPGT